MGDYRAGGIAVMGFKFFSERNPAKPDVLKFEWSQGTNTYFKEVSSATATTGVWYQLMFALVGKDQSGWSGSGAAEFEGALQAVDEIRVTVQTTPPAGPSVLYRLDDVFIDYAPTATAIARSVSNLTVTTWDVLQSNAAYSVQGVAALGGTWSNLVSFAATGRTHSVVATNEGGLMFFRAVVP